MGELPRRDFKLGRSRTQYDNDAFRQHFNKVVPALFLVQFLIRIEFPYRYRARHYDPQMYKHPCSRHVLRSKEDLSSSRASIQFSIFVPTSRQQPVSRRHHEGYFILLKDRVRTTRDPERCSPFLRPCRVPLSSDCRFRPRRAGMRSPEGYSP